VRVELERFEKQEEPENQSAVGLIKFRPKLNEKAKISYNYSWWAVNSFALNQERELSQMDV
jgi:hypothetical protein